MTYAELRSALMANEHQHALEGVAKVRFLMLEGQLTRAVEARRTAERKLHEHVCTENDELNRAKAENRRLQRELDVMARTLSLAAPLAVGSGNSREILNPPRPFQRPGRKGPPRKSSTAIRNSELVQRALRGEPLPEPPEPGTFDPTIDEET